MNPKPSPEQQAAGAQLGHQLSTAVVAYHQAIADRLGLGATEWKCLDALAAAGSLSAGRLAELTGLSSGAITGIVDRLERAGHARRDRDPNDRRRTIIRAELDPRLADEITRIRASLAAGMAWVYEDYTTEQLELIADYLRKAVASLQAETRRLRTPTSSRPTAG